MVSEFLTGRIQRVQCEGLSTQAAVTSGVIQSSCLGPILWSIFMDSLLSEIDIPSVALADDFKLLASLVRHSHSTVQENIDRIYAYGLNVCECHYQSVNVWSYIMVSIILISYTIVGQVFYQLLIYLCISV